MPSTLVWALCIAASLCVIYVVIRQIQRMAAPQVRESAPSKAPLRTQRTKSGLQSEVLEEGTGPGAKTGDLLTVHYEARLSDGGPIVDSSYQRARSFTFKLGAGKVIAGWDTALKGVKAGEKCRVTVPASLAYGKKGSESGKIPPGATVIFEITILSIE